jgi:ABC-type antimicrobial peptide transport system permease subunit
MYALTDNFSGIEKLTSSAGWPRGGEMNVPQKDNTFLTLSTALLEVDTSFLRFFSVQLIEGNLSTATRTANSIVLQESFAGKFGDPAELVGATVTIDETTYQITGIMKDFPKTTTVMQGDGFVMNKTDGYYSRTHDTWNPATQGSIFVMLRDGVSVTDMQRQFGVYPFDFVMRPDSDYRDKVFIMKLKGAALSQQGTVFALAGFFVVGLLVLLMALFNYISFQTAKFYNRLHECAIRKVNGAGKWHQWLLFSIEVAIVFVVACGMGFLLLDVLIAPLISRSEFAPMIDQFTLDELRMQLLKYAGFGLALALLLCVFPSRAVNRLSTRKVLLGLSEKGKRHNARAVLLFIQMVILLVFLSATVIIQMQVNRVKSQIFTCMTVGEQKHTITVPFYYKALLGNQEILSARLKASAAIEDICWAEFPLTTYGSISLYDTGLPGREKERMRMYKVSSDFPDFFHAKMRRGLFFNENSLPNEVVVDETFAALYPDGNPVGKSFERFTIIGVIENIQMVKENDQHTQARRPVFYTQAQPGNSATLYVKAVPGSKKDAQHYLTTCLREFAPKPLELTISDFHAEIGKIFEIERAQSLFAMIFAVISIVLSLLSIYSAVAMNTEKRRKEVAIRKINGAQVFDIIRLFGKMYVVLWTAACVMVFPVVYLVAKQWVSKFNQTMSLHIGLFLSIYFAVLLLIILTVLHQILSVARTNPAEVIKN